ncbi:hypothetical protein PF010_g17071 [Phytophthora fragariae]|uniref:Putative auto-transporter adhesin head GIN domain-containing protein n=2 Tax=Phytophthora fragariae TaxID=53985 RepID=A0A6G0R9L3_9STRA|nr:hypothetical protein PF010_g17071 [Phytophthora fragariae]KAE9324925.1 hypothetical protein PF008_g17001 [Phytophthora fragariae]
MKRASLFTALAFAMTQTVTEGALSVTSTEPSRANDLSGAFIEKVWTVRGEDGDVLDTLKAQVAGNVFVDYDASLHATDSGVAAKVVLRSSSPDMLDIVDVAVHDGLRVHYKNENVRVTGRVVTQITVSDPNVVSSVSAMHADGVVVGDGVVVTNDSSASLNLDSSSDAELFVGSLTQEFALKSIEVGSSGDSHVQIVASSIQADSVAIALTGDSKAVLEATDKITVDSLLSSISGDGKIYVQTAHLQAQTLAATLSGDGQVSYSSAGSCANQAIRLSGDAAVYAGSIVCKNSTVQTSGDGKAFVQTTDTLTTVGGGAVKYVNAPPQRIVSSSSFRKHSHVKLAKYNKVKTHYPSIPPTKAPTELTIVLKGAWIGDSPHVSVYSGMGSPICINGTGFAVTDIPAYHHMVGPFGVAVAVAFVAAVAAVAFKLRERQTREQYKPLV